MRLNSYQTYIEDELGDLKRRVPLIRSFTHIHNLTPLLLPRANFCGVELEDMIARLYQSLGTTDDPANLIEGEVAAFLTRYPRVYPKAEGRHPKGQHCFSDGSLYFRSPGKNRHGFFRVGRDRGHAPACLLNARSRLGGSYRHNFHFDCDPTSGVLKAAYPNCHAHNTASKERHINIAPNDYIIG